MLEVTTENFDSNVMQSNIPVLIDFWASWCAPCQALAPVLEELAIDLDGLVIVAKVNIEESPELASQFSVRSIPTLCLLKDGKTIATHTGFAPKEDLITWVKEHI